MFQTLKKPVAGHLLVHGRPVGQAAVAALLVFVAATAGCVAPGGTVALGTEPSSPHVLRIVTAFNGTSMEQRGHGDIVNASRVPNGSPASFGHLLVFVDNVAGSCHPRGNYTVGCPFHTDPQPFKDRRMHDCSGQQPTPRAILPAPGKHPEAYLAYVLPANGTMELVTESPVRVAFALGGSYSDEAAAYLGDRANHCDGHRPSYVTTDLRLDWAAHSGNLTFGSGAGSVTWTGDAELDLHWMGACTQPLGDV